MFLKRILPLFLVTLFICSCDKKLDTIELPVEPEQAQLSESEKSVLKELNLAATVCKSAAPINDASDLQVLDVLANVKVLGLGEATHGTKEFFQMKHRIFKYFVEKHGFKIFGFEADMAECIHIDRFINGNNGTINDAMNKMHFWTWKTEEVKELILWMKQYNEGKSEKDRIHLIGVDCQYIDQNKQLILEYLDKYDKNYPKNLKDQIDLIFNTNTSTISTMSTAVFNSYKMKCDSITNYFKDNKIRMMSASGEFEYNLIERLTIQSKQVFDVYFDRTYNYRDFYMAENTIWLTNLLGQNTKVVSWAHNMHVAKYPNYGGSGSQGHHLNVQLGGDYAVLGFSFSNGLFRAVNYDGKNYTGLMNHAIFGTPLRESSNYLFYYANLANFILVNKNLANYNQLNNWYAENRKFLSIGAAYSSTLYSSFFYSLSMKQYFDGMIHFNNTNAAVPFAN